MASTKKTSMNNLFFLKLKAFTTSLCPPLHGMPILEQKKSILHHVDSFLARIFKRWRTWNIFSFVDLCSNKEIGVILFALMNLCQNIARFPNCIYLSRECQGGIFRIQIEFSCHFTKLLMTWSSAFLVWLTMTGQISLPIAYFME